MRGGELVEKKDAGTGLSVADGICPRCPRRWRRSFTCGAARYAAERAVGRPEIQEFVGLCTGLRPIAGSSSPPAGSRPRPLPTRTASRPRVILLDGLARSGLMVRYNVGVQDQQTYVIKRIDKGFFDEN